MPRTLLIVPTGHGVGLTSTSLALVAACERQGVAVAFCKPIAQRDEPDAGDERSSALIRLGTTLKPPRPITRTISMSPSRPIRSGRSEGGRSGIVVSR